MKLKELINELNAILNSKGDVEVKLSETLPTNTTGVYLNTGYIVAIGENKLGRTKNLPSPKQVYYLNKIYKVHGLICTETTKTGVTKFLNEHIEKVDNLDIKLNKEDYVYSYPTTKQLDFIKYLEEKTGVVFEGATFEEANHFIVYTTQNTRPPVFEGRKVPYPVNIQGETYYNTGFVPVSFSAINDEDLPF